MSKQWEIERFGSYWRCWVTARAGRVAFHGIAFSDERHHIPQLTAAQARSVAAAMLEAADWILTPEGLEDGIRDARAAVVDADRSLRYLGIEAAEEEIAAWERIIEAAGGDEWVRRLVNDHAQLHERRERLKGLRRDYESRQRGVVEPARLRLVELKYMAEGHTEEEAHEHMMETWRQWERDKEMAAFEAAVERTGAFATEDEAVEIRAAAEEAGRTPVVMLGGIDLSGEAWLKARRVCHEIARHHGLPEFDGHYGLAENNEFVRPKEATVGQDQGGGMA